jgi:pyruvyl transferase EpsO
MDYIHKDNYTWHELMVSLTARHSDIYDEIGGNSKIAYLDIPMHFNVGDLLIYKGTESFFLKNNIEVIYRESKTKLFSNYFLIGRADVLVFHGGGNFGDLYPDFQRYRDRIIRRFPHKKIVILPQTIYFRNKKNMTDSFDLLKSHKNLVLYVRDEHSFFLAKSHGVNVCLMPDMAHSLHPLKDKCEVGAKHYWGSYPLSILNLQRCDMERTAHSDLRHLDKRAFDWKNLISTSDKFFYILCKISFKIPIVRNYFINLYGDLTDNIVFKAMFYFEQHDVIYTDRLHGLILAALLGKNIVVFDNSYGKNERYISSWLLKYPFFDIP